jgi:hypothetical protein
MKLFNSQKKMDTREEVIYQGPEQTEPQTKDEIQEMMTKNKNKSPREDNI